MKLVFIRPNMGKSQEGRYIDAGSMEPLPLGLLAAMTPDDVETVLFDDRIEDIPFEEHADLVAITVETFNARRSYEISREFRQRGVPVVLGGFHPSLIPEEAARHADAVCIGDAESVWSEIVEDARRGRLKPFYHGVPGLVQGGHSPRRDLYAGKKYLPISLLQFGRGCRFSCEFCAISTYFDKKHYHRKVDQVLEEINDQPRKLLFFVDDNIACDRTAFKELCRELAPMKVRWVGQCSLDVTDDPELMRLMADSGCLGHVMGFESLDARNLAAMAKKPNMAAFDGFRRQIRILREYGLQTWAAFTLGHDFDTSDSIRATLEFAIREKFTFAAFNLLTPYPNTPLYRRLKSEGRLICDPWWLHPDYRFNHTVFIPRRISPEELTQLSFEARREFSSLPSIIWRAFDPRTNMRSPYRLGIYLRFNPLIHQEVKRKQGLMLGNG